MQDYRLLASQYNSPNNLAQYQAYQARWANGFPDFLHESRDSVLNDFIKLILVDRRGEAYFDSSNVTEVRVRNNGNAISYTLAHAVEKQGSCVSVSAMADEKYETPDGSLVDYTASQFINQLVWAIAHEIGHLLTAGHIDSTDGHLSVSNILMTNTNPAPSGITIITSSAEELEKIDLKNKFSVSH